MKYLLLVASVVLSTCLFSQSDVKIFDNLVSKDSSSVPVLFSYPDSVRNAILVASTYPQGFVRLNEIQKMSSASFKKIISQYNQRKQKQLWEITRYPGLTALLIENKGKSQQDLDGLLKKYPDKIKHSAIYFMKKKYSTLVEMENIRQDFATKYKAVSKDFPVEVQHSFNLLLSYPELVTVLSQDMKTTVTLGDLYKRNSQMVKHKVDSLNREIAKARGMEYEEWKRGIASDTAVQKELKKVSKEYQKDMEEDDIYAGGEQNEAIVKDFTPYPYWAGYPYWYGRDYWYPYPWWWQLGFYWPLDGPIVFWGMPSFHFGWWFYNQPHYYSHYPNTSNYFNRQYEGHRNSNSGFNRGIRESYRGRRR